VAAEFNFFPELSFLTSKLRNSLQEGKTFLRLCEFSEQCKLFYSLKSKNIKILLIYE